MRAGIAIAGATVALAALVAGLGVGARESSYADVARGRYLVSAGSCAGCHTAPHGEPFAGGRPIETPFGIVYSANITPDRETGIGAWTDEDFYRALHSGVDPYGRHLYPAFPYPDYRHITREDTQAIRAYLRTLEPVHARKPENDLSWPLGNRFLLSGWNALFLGDGDLDLPPDASADLARGAYLVEGLGHCGACHTPKNSFGASDTDTPLAGAELQDWFAPALTGDERSGLGAWSKAELIEYLHTGRNERTAAFGPMAEVVARSTSHLTEEDLSAIATYLKSLPAQDLDATAQNPAQDVMGAGADIYAAQCAACHRADGQGVPRLFARLKGSAIVQSSNPATLIHAILKGIRSVATDDRPTGAAMPAFEWKLSNEETAAVATYVRNSWGNVAAPVTADEVDDMRESLHAKKIQ